MIKRRLTSVVEATLDRYPAVALLGPRQVGKTTLALGIAARRPSMYLDLEAPSDRNKLSEPELYLSAHSDKLVVLDEVQRVPDLFRVLRGLIDRNRRNGRRHGQYLLLGSASIALLRQSSESLAGRIAYLELGPFDALEVAGRNLDTLWHRGGFPDSFLARTEAASLDWRLHFIRTYLERDVPQLGPRIPAETLRRFWTMLAHSQGSLLNAARLATSLGISGQTVARYLDLLVDLLLVRRLPPWRSNVGKRLVKSPKVYIRDSGIVHGLLRLSTHDDLLAHPVVGSSWEGFVAENLLAVAPPSADAGFYRTSAGAEIDLVLSFDSTVWAVEVKRSLSPQPSKGFKLAADDIGAERRLIVYPGTETVPLGSGVRAVSLPDAMNELRNPSEVAAGPAGRRSRR